jgi:hypothetical protein
MFGAACWSESVSPALLSNMQANWSTHLEETRSCALVLQAASVTAMAPPTAVSGQGLTELQPLPCQHWCMFQAATTPCRMHVDQAEVPAVCPWLTVNSVAQPGGSGTSACGCSGLCAIRRPRSHGERHAGLELAPF